MYKENNKGLVLLRETNRSASQHRFHLQCICQIEIIMNKSDLMKTKDELLTIMINVITFNLFSAICDIRLLIK